MTPKELLMQAAREIEEENYERGIKLSFRELEKKITERWYDLLRKQEAS